jgi:hypothetical protein
MANGYFSSDPVNIREESLNYLRTHRNWYVRWTNFNKNLWNLSNVAIMILGAATSILAALNRPGGAQDPLTWTDSLTIAMPALASLLSAILVQWRVYEKWQLREEGRIDLEELLCEAHLIRVDEPEKTLKKAIELRRRAITIERTQANRFFALAPQGSDPRKLEANDGSEKPGA